MHSHILGVVDMQEQTKSWSQLLHSDHSSSKHNVLQMYLYKNSWHCHNMFWPNGMEIWWTTVKS